MRLEQKVKKILVKPTPMKQKQIIILMAEFQTKKKKIIKREVLIYSIWLKYISK